MSNNPEDIEVFDGEFADDENDDELQENYYDLQEKTQDLEYEFTLASDASITNSEADEIVKQYFPGSFDLDEDVLELEEYFGFE